VDDRLFDGLRAALHAGQTADTALVGRGDRPFREVHQGGGFLIGLYLHIGEFRGYTTISSISPMFWTRQGRERGEYYGLKNKTARHAFARPGYAVGGLRVRYGEGIDSLSVIFMRIKGNRLDPSDSYESPVYGGTGGRTREPTLLGGTGSMIVGLYGKTSNDPQSTFMALGLVTATGN
jgi:hypothetical protein